MRVLFSLLASALVMSCNKQVPLTGPPDEVAVPTKNAPANDKPATVAKEVEELIYEHDLFKYPEVTVLLAVKDAQRTARLIVEGGGKIVYDPNLSTGHDIGFLVADIPPKKLLDAGFVKSLDLKAMDLDRSQLPTKVKPNFVPAGDVEPDLFVPWKDIKIDELRKRKGNTRGKGMVVAIIDTGVDPSHYAFQNRVIYWSDLTREGRTAVKKAEVKGGKVVFGKDKEWAIPADIDQGKPVYQGVISEKALSVQFSLTARIKGDSGFDIDGNGLFDDEYAFFVGSTKGEKSALVAYVDSDGDKKFSEKELKSPVMDFNEARSYQRTAKSYLKTGSPLPAAAAGAALLVIPSRHKTRAFPLIFQANEKNELETVTIGADLQQHGTHVAGIIAGNDGRQVEGAAPEAEILSLKVCSGITCSEAAILKGLVDAFYNPQGLIPDVVNISLGSLEGFEERTFNILMRDLAAKFGATFFVSASNDGPGYRSLNAFAATGPEVMVGAYVSRNTLMRHYAFDPGVKVPEHSLHSFTSVGPSYTGQLRPNIVAPGSAISSTPMSLGASAMFNGTSMASPIAAGSALAMLGLARTVNDNGEIENEEIRKLEGRRRAKVSAVINHETQGESYSNISVPMIVRTALEDGATKMPHYTAAQRGHGLIQIDAAYEGFLKLSKKVNDGEAIFADFRINNNSKPGLYDRQLPIAEAKLVNLAIESDGEASRETYFLANETLTVSLDQVEIQDTDGSVKSLSGDSVLEYFAVARRGVEDKPARSATVVLSSGPKSSFISVRKPAAYEVGKTYLAHYNLYRAGQRLFSFLDVVHSPFLLPTTPVIVDIPALDVEKREKVGAFFVKERAIEANSFHRYPIAVGPNDSSLSVAMAIPANAGGSLSLIVHDANGKQVGSAKAFRSPQMPKDPAEQRIARLTVDTTDSKGIYEVIVASSGRWNGPTQYDVLVEAAKFNVSAEKIKLAVGESTSIAFTSPQIQSAYSSVTDLERLETVKVGLRSQHWTFKKIPFPSNEEGGSDFMRLEISTAVENKDSADFNGDLVPTLYYLKDGKTPEVAYQAAKGISNGGKLVFEDVERSGRPVYLAVETYNNLKSSKSPSLGLVTDYFVDIVYSGIILKQEGALSVSPVPSSDKAISVFKVEAPKKLPQLPAGNHKAPRGRAKLRVNTDQQDIKAEIPITIVQ